ncbi:MAG: hypothetical protein II401_09115 [Bacteroidales bacterium]|nr:hypothetical protein [Bacteroidales bacterium]
MSPKAKKYKVKKQTVIFVEGDADEMIFRRLIAYYMENGWKCDTHIEYVNANGFPTEAKIASKLRQIENCSKGVVVHFKTVCCEYDSDVFDLKYQRQPNWKIIKAHLKDKFELSGFCHIEARTSIEDWILDDTEGLLNALNLPQDTKLKGTLGQDKVSDLFWKKNIIYNRYKGKNNIRKFIEKLDIAKIRDARKKELKEFEKLLGVSINR